MIKPFYDLTLLSIESAGVINKRLRKIARGGPQSIDEIWLMFAEKRHAAFEATLDLMVGGTPAGTVNRLREHVAANEARLSI